MMNIFRILSFGGSNLKEPNFSSFLGYFLDPSEDHQINVTILSSFLKKIGININDGDLQSWICSIKVEAAFRQKEGLKKEKPDIHIVLENKGEAIEIFVEVKIQKESIRKNQIIDQLKAVNKVTNSKLFYVLISTHTESDEIVTARKSIYGRRFELHHLSWKKDIVEVFDVIQTNNEIFKYLFLSLKEYAENDFDRGGINVKGKNYIQYDECARKFNKIAQYQIRKFQNDLHEWLFKNFSFDVPKSTERKRNYKFIYRKNNNKSAYSLRMDCNSESMEILIPVPKNQLQKINLASWEIKKSKSPNSKSTIFKKRLNITDDSKSFSAIKNDIRKALENIS